uniref:HAD family hydrolase n=1 Tax=Gracilinema caldarium TaxID=215591 RepID=A0A7C3I8J5_9SPIR
MISYLLFDLDNTLYSSSFGLEKAVGERIRRFTAQFLGVSEEEAVRRRQERIAYYGTTLEWLMAEAGLTDVETYYQAIHPEGEEANLYPDPKVREFLEQLPYPKAILTNSPMEHAQRIIKKLEMEGLFTHIFDIRWNGLQGKPQPEAFYRVLKTLGKSPQEVLFIDDYPSYVKGYLDIGGRGILLDEEDLHKDYPYDRIKSIFELQHFLEQ